VTPLPRPYAALSTKFLRDPVPVHEANLNYYRIQKTMVDTERLAERGTLLYRLGSELIASCRILVETLLSVAQITHTRDFLRSQVFLRESIHTTKEAKKGS
jgi:hypothetical protein